MDTKRRFRFPRTFRLRSLLVFVLLFAITLSYVSTVLREHEREKAAQAKLALFSFEDFGPRCGLELACSIWREPSQKSALARWVIRVCTGDSEDLVVKQYLECEWRPGRDLFFLSDLSELEDLAIGGDFGDQEFEQIKPCPRVQHLKLCSNKLTDASLDAVAKWPRLQALDVVHTPVTGQGLAAFVSRKQLTFLELNMRQLHEGSKDLTTALTELKTLSLGREGGGCIRLDDQVVDILTGLPKGCVVKRLFGPDPNESSEALSRLKRLRPDIVVETRVSLDADNNVIPAEKGKQRADAGPTRRP